MQKNLGFDWEFDQKMNQIMKNAGPETRAAPKEAALDWIAYQKAMSEAIETSYAEHGVHGGDEAIARNSKKPGTVSWQEKTS